MQRLKLIVTLFFLLAIAATFSELVEAIPTIVNGHVYSSDGRTPVINTLVKVSCNSTDLFDLTNFNGFYLVEFPSNCEFGSLVTATSNSVIASDIVNNILLDKNIVYINLILQNATNKTIIRSTNKRHLLQIKSLSIEDDFVKDGNYLVVYTRVKNVGSHDEKSVKVRLTIPDLGIIEQTTINQLNKNIQKLKIFSIQIPKNTEKNYHYLKVQVFNENSQETEYAEFRII